jgi:hypothetical protein
VLSSPMAPGTHSLNLKVNILAPRSAATLDPPRRGPYAPAALSTMLLNSRGGYCVNLLPEIPKPTASRIPVFALCSHSSGPGRLHLVSLPWDAAGSDRRTTWRALKLLGSCVLTCRASWVASQSRGLVSCPRTTVPALTFCPWVVWTSLPGCMLFGHRLDGQDSQTVDPPMFFRVEAARMELHQTKTGPATIRGPSALDGQERPCHYHV